MLVTVDPSSPLPVYEQLRSQLQRLISSGQLPVGTRLPTIRQMAADLGVASATVSRVYEMLASDGWVTAAGRRGTVVHRQPAAADLRAEIVGAADHLALLARQSGLDRDELQALLDRALGDAPPSR